MSAKNKQGFTLLELLIAAVAFSIFTLSVGLMLVHGWRSWYAGNEAVNMQRDATLAQTVIRREVRCSAINDISVSEDRIDFAASGVRTGSGEESIYLSGNDLIHSGPDGDFTLVRGMITGFSASIQDKGVNIVLTFQASSGGDSSSQTFTAYARN
jgi:prepilin-type N-terminal cleavage/methylation domain-containing protein